MKLPINWPAELKLKKLSKAGVMGDSEWAVTHGEDTVAHVYVSSRGWAYAGQGDFADAVGRSGQGFLPHPSMVEALYELASHWPPPNMDLAIL